MAILAIVSILLGAVLGVRFKVLILVPTIALGLGAVLIGGLLAQATMAQMAVTAVLTDICLQVGYFAGVGIHLFLAWARVPGLYPNPQNTTRPITRSIK
jgi:hypothetical protein